MGSSSSKVSRKLPSKPSPSWAGARTDRNGPPRPSRTVAASETKDDPLIRKDAADPTQDLRFLEKLKQLGEVKVDHHMRPIAAYGHMRHVVESQKASEEEAASAVPPRNRLRTSELFSALKERKSVRSREQLQRLSNQYNLDMDVLERIARYTNTPSIIEETRQRVVDNDGNERFTVLATWKDPPLGRSSKASPHHDSHPTRTPVPKMF